MAMQDIEWLDPLVARERDREFERYAKQRAGIVPAKARFLAPCPWLLRADFDLLGGGVHVDRDLADLIYLVVSQDNSCRYCYAAQRVMMRLLGMSDDRIERLEQDVETARLEPKIRAALEYARRVSRANPLPDAADKKRLLDLGYSEIAIKEVAVFAGKIIFHTRVSTLLALPVERAERMARSRLIDFIRPLIGRRLRRIRQTARPEALGDELKTGPYTDLILALDGLPVASVLRRIIDDAWASPHTSLRMKALVFAVIARGLGCTFSEREAYRLLAIEGLADTQVDEILAHLASRDLDPIDERTLAYARESIWPQPASVQRRGQELKEELTDAQFLERIGVVALANLVCRLEVVLSTA